MNILRRANIGHLITGRSSTIESARTNHSALPPQVWLRFAGEVGLWAGRLCKDCVTHPLSCPDCQLIQCSQAAAGQEAGGSPTSQYKVASAV